MREAVIVFATENKYGAQVLQIQNTKIQDTKYKIKNTKPLLTK